MSSSVHAAGGVLWRGGELDLHIPLNIEVALVHRPHYDDWSLPKGKLRRGENPLRAACREVLEETGVRPAVGPRLPAVSYPVRVDGRTLKKTVDYWAMSVAADGGFTPGAEVDQVAWLSVDEAMERLSYAHDMDVLTAFGALPPVTGMVVLVRHAHAGTREAWDGPDGTRPLDPAGLGRAQEIAELLVWLAPRRLVSAAPYRCVQTLVPLADMVGLPIEVDSNFDESADPALAATLLRELGGASRSTVVCSQGKLIPATMAALVEEGSEPFTTPKGAAWVLSFTGSRVTQVDRLPRT